MQTDFQENKKYADGQTFAKVIKEQYQRKQRLKKLIMAVPHQLDLVEKNWIEEQEN